MHVFYHCLYVFRRSTSTEVVLLKCHVDPALKNTPVFLFFFPITVLMLFLCAELYYKWTIV